MSIVALIILAGCASSRPPTSVEPPRPIEVQSPHEIASRLEASMQPWRQTPHRLGGMSLHGADCSGFIVRLYQDAFDVELPRTTREQVYVGDAVSRDNLQVGDLVFFRPGRVVNHVGVYLSEGRFAHISTSRGFIISHLDEPYWRTRYAVARRVIEPAYRPAIIAPPSDAPSVRSSRRALKSGRGGW